MGGGGGRGGVGGGVGFWGQGGCERRIEVFVKIQKKKNIFFGGSGGGVSGWGVRVDVNEELNFLKKKFVGVGSGGGQVGDRVGGGSGWM